MKTVFLCFLLTLYSGSVWSSEYSALVKNLEVELSGGDFYKLNAEITYSLSPTAKKALQKGISLTWLILIEVKQQGVFWDTVVREFEIPYQIRNHELLNLYSVKEKIESPPEFYSSLTAAFNSISKISDLSIVDKSSLLPGQVYHIAVKVLFNREALPIPLRPLSYFDGQWDLSSSWIIWPLQN